MEIFAVFETWHLADGNYPALRKGQLVNLSFEIEPDELTILADDDYQPRFHHLGQAEYEFTGTALRVYHEQSISQIVVIEADWFRFYVFSPVADGIERGDRVSGRGTLALDHYIWVEFLCDYDDPPDLFSGLRVADISRVRIPERFIARSGSSTCVPTRVKPDQYGADDVASVEKITDEDYVSFIVRFSDLGTPLVAIPRTFHSVTG